MIALRAVQGVFGALLQPATLALLRLAYPPERIGGPVAARTAAIGVAAAAGPLLGGVLVEHFGWRAVFVVNVPAALAIAAAALFVRVPVPPSTEPGRIRPGGAVLLATALAVLVHALAGVPQHGWAGPRTLAGFGAAASLAALLVRSERRSAQPLVPRPVARSVPVTASVLLLALVSAALFGALFGASFALQDAAGLDPLATGLRVLPMTAAMVIGAPVAGAALRRFGARGTALAGTGLVVLGIIGLGPGWGFAVLGAGFAAVMVTATGTVVGDAPAGYAGVVGGLKQTAMNVGPALGIAVAAGTGASVAALAALAAVGLLPASRLPASRPAATGPDAPRPDAPQLPSSRPPAPYPASPQLPASQRPARPPPAPQLPTPPPPTSRLSGPARAGHAGAGHLVGEGAGERGEGGPAADGPADGERRQGGDRHQAQRSV